MNQQIQVLNNTSPDLPATVNAGAVTIEAQRAITEAQGKIQLAKMFPRHETAAYDRLMFACSQPTFAEEAFYSRPQGGKTISGPSIRLAEEIARVYGNFIYGHKELSRTQGKSEVEVFAWDIENNNYSSRQITVMHVQDTKNGSYALKNQADIDTRISNIASKQLRGRILALVPKWMLAGAVERCRQTLTGELDKEKRQERISALEKRFAARNVTRDSLEAYLGHPLSLITDEEIADLFGVYTALKDGAQVQEFFLIEPLKQVQSETAARLEKALNQNAEAGDTAENPIEKPVEKPARTTRKKQQPEQTADAPVETDDTAQAEQPEQNEQPDAAQPSDVY